jgi:nucleoside-diphosphate-sugar epimerase
MAGLVAITGATGFVGGYTAKALAEAGWRVRLLCRRLPLSPLLSDISPEIVLGDLEDPAALAALVRGADAVVHAAGAVRALDAVGFYRANADGTARMVAAVRADAPQARFVLISSLSAREPTLSAYAGSKRAGEIELERAAGAALDWSILRPPAVYGPGDRELLPRACRWSTPRIWPEQSGRRSNPAPAAAPPWRSPMRDPAATTGPISRPS